MGSASSQPAASVEHSPASKTLQEIDDKASETTTSTRTKQEPTIVVDPKEASLSGMALVQYKCRKRKKLYDRCVSRWYSREFLPGKSIQQDQACGDLFDQYRACVLKGIKKELWDKQGLPPPKEGSLLDEFTKELEEDDERKS